jgi:hypothetical protein
LPADELDRLLVHGEPVAITDGELEGVHFPSYRELADRYGVAHSLIARFAKEHNCLGRRKQIKRNVRQLSDEKLTELRADAVAFSRDDQVRTVDRFLAQFEEATIEGRVRCDDPSDFNTMCRLRAFLMGEADSRSEVSNGMPTLEELQERHREMLEEWEQATPEERQQLPEYLYGFDGVARDKAQAGRGEAIERVDSPGYPQRDDITLDVDTRVDTQRDEAAVDIGHGSHSVNEEYPLKVN